MLCLTLMMSKPVGILPWISTEWPARFGAALAESDLLRPFSDPAGFSEVSKGAEFSDMLLG